MPERVLQIAVKQRRARGFSLVEMMVTVAILVILVAISVPTLTKAYHSYQLSDAAARFSGVLKSTRFSAIRKNAPVFFRVQQSGGTWTAWSDFDGDGNPGSTEPQSLVSGTVMLLDGGSVPASDAIATAVGSASLNVLSPGNSSVKFDQRGACPGATSVNVFYFGNTTIPDFGFRAVVLLPSGMVQVWTAGPGGPWQRVS